MSYFYCNILRCLRTLIYLCILPSNVSVYCTFMSLLACVICLLSHPLTQNLVDTMQQSLQYTDDLFKAQNQFNHCEMVCITAISCAVRLRRGPVLRLNCNIFLVWVWPVAKGAVDWEMMGIKTGNCRLKVKYSTTELHPWDTWWPHGCCSLCEHTCEPHHHILTEWNEGLRWSTWGHNRGMTSFKTHLGESPDSYHINLSHFVYCVYRNKYLPFYILLFYTIHIC